MTKAHVMARKVVVKYIIDLKRAPKPIEYWHSSYMTQRSYAKTAAYEIKDMLRNSSEPPLVIIEEYRDKMKEYASLNPFGSTMFSVAQETAENIIDAIVGSCY